MGTNYYIEKPVKCPSCGSTVNSTRVHIGKKSAGWKFALAVDNFGSMSDLVSQLIEYGAVNEYGDEVEAIEMMEVIFSGSTELRGDGGGFFNVTLTSGVFS